MHPTQPAAPDSKSVALVHDTASTVVAVIEQPINEVLDIDGT